MNRTHFVYRIYDEYSLLLYVGCTAHPENRYKQHRADKAPWLPFVSKIRMEGPYTKAAGFAQEKSVIATEEPFFNALPAHMAHNRKRRTMLDQGLDRLRRTRPDLFPAQGRAHDPDLFAAFRMQYEGIEGEVNRSLPEIGKEWRLAHYLNTRRREAVVPA